MAKVMQFTISRCRGAHCMPTWQYKVDTVIYLLHIFYREPSTLIYCLCCMRVNYEISQERCLSFYELIIQKQWLNESGDSSPS